jgi:hypothetical protein
MTTPAQPCAVLEFTLGMALARMGEVATGTKPIATGEIRRGDRQELQELHVRSGYEGLVHLGFRRADGQGNVGYCLWRHAWAKKALDWLDRGGRDALGRQRHWVQGLLFGYSAESIGEFLSTPSRAQGRVAGGTR